MLHGTIERDGKLPDVIFNNGKLLKVFVCIGIFRTSRSFQSNYV